MERLFATVVLLVLTGMGQAFRAQERGGNVPPQLLRLPPSRGTASIAGHVMTPGTNSPVRGADVVATNRTGATVPAVTDENGAYQIDRLAAGEWQVTASKAGYITWQFDQRRPFQAPHPIALANGQRFTADIPLTRGGAISGRIFDAAGDSVAGAQVRVYRAVIQQGSRRLKAVGATDSTDDLGAFRVYGLPPGDYYVAASLRVAPIDSVVETTYAPTYFPGTGDLAEAQRVKLGLGAEITATFPLLPIRPARVSGVVLSASGGPGNAFLNLVSEATELGVPIGVGGVTRADGTFTLADVAPGRYLLKASLRGDGPDESGSQPLVVSGDDISGITLVTGRPATIRGTIVADTGVTRTLPTDVRVIAFSAREPGTVLDSGDGLKFEVGSLTEPFKITVEGLSGEWVVKQIAVGDVDALDDPIELAPGQQAAARIVLTDRLTEVAGVVAPSDPSSPSSIVVFPENSTKWGARSRYIRRVQSDARGNFRIVGLPPGEPYLAIATDYLEDGEHLDPEFLTAIRNAARAFSLAASEKRTVELKVIER